MAEDIDSQDVERSELSTPPAAERAESGERFVRANVTPRQRTAQRWELYIGPEARAIAHRAQRKDANGEDRVLKPCES